MGIRNYLIEGVSGAGKTTVSKALAARGYYTLNTDNDLAYKGDPATGIPKNRPDFASETERVNWVFAHQIWNLDEVRRIISDQSEPMAFFCGGSRNFDHFIDLFDDVFVLHADAVTIMARLKARVDEWGSKQVERDLVMRELKAGTSLPKQAILIDTTKELNKVIDEILSHCT